MVCTVTISLQPRFGTRCLLVLSTEIFVLNRSSFLFVQAYSLEAPLRTWFKRHLTKARFDCLIQYMNIVMGIEMIGYGYYVLMY